MILQKFAPQAVDNRKWSSTIRDPKTCTSKIQIGKLRVSHTLCKIIYLIEYSRPENRIWHFVHKKMFVPRTFSRGLGGDTRRSVFLI